MLKKSLTALFVALSLYSSGPISGATPPSNIDVVVDEFREAERRPTRAKGTW